VATINPVPGAPVMGGGGTQCGGTLPVTASPGSGGAGIRWWDGNTETTRYWGMSGYCTAVTISAEGCESGAAGVSVTINPVPGAPVMGGGGTQCGGTLPVTASPGSGGAGIRWWDGNTETTRYVSSSGNYTAVTTSAAGCESGAAGVSATINPVPSISLTGGVSSQTVNHGAAITTITYTAYNATSIALSSGSFPPGVTGTPSGSNYIISGTPMVSGTYNYTITASHTNGCNSTPVTGTIMVMPNAPPFARSTYTIKTEPLVWSDVINKPLYFCQQTELPAGEGYRYEYKIYQGVYYYNWYCAYQLESDLCPSPWRYPTADDIELLLSVYGEESARIVFEDLGYYSEGQIYNYGERSYAWTPDWNGFPLMYEFRARGSSTSRPWPHRGIPMRCVK
jgi:hypothetical protein